MICIRMAKAESSLSPKSVISIHTFSCICTFFGLWFFSYLAFSNLLILHTLHSSNLSQSLALCYPIFLYILVLHFHHRYVLHFISAIHATPLIYILFEPNIELRIRQVLSPFLGCIWTTSHICKKKKEREERISLLQNIVFPLLALSMTSID